MNLFDIVGPVMVGPSSSHTAGAVRIGQVSRHLLGESVKEAKILLHGSFLATGKGHGTDKALVAGLLGMAADDIRIPDSFDIAKESGVKFEIGKIQLKNAHPNSVKLLLVGESGRNLEIVACSLGGGRIKICTIDGLEANFSGEYTTLVVHNDDQPGHVAEVPCIKRNVIGSVNAITASDMAMAGIESKVPLDEVIDAMAEVGDLLPCSLKETSQAGLAQTETGKKYMPEL